ncbi:MAG: 3-hydroxyacyl-CoA dehydrogenase NAD-binding domain-containing protein [Gammaproteobacteria bacterium]
MNDTPLRSWHESRDADGIVWLTLDKPQASVNTLSTPVLEELGEIVSRLVAHPPRGVVLQSGKPSGFVLGADVKEFTTLRSLDEARALVLRGHRVLAALEQLPCPSVACIEGFALGGGLELALACTYRVALDDERLSLGLPEVLLGIHPGFGGTVRAVRTIGALAALDMMLTGRNIKGAKTRTLGLVDRLEATPEACRHAARELIQRNPGAHRPPLWQRALSCSPLRPFVRRQLRAQVARKVREDHYPSPYAIIELWAKYGAAGDRAYQAEADSIAALAATRTAQNLIRVFMLQDALKSQGKQGADPPQRVHVIGAGVMGADIAAWCALRGLEVTLQDREQQFIDAALARVSSLFEKRIRDSGKRALAVARLRGDLAGDGVAQADVIIEAIIENADAKRQLYATLEPRMRAGAILATNTSSIRLEDLAQNLREPSRLVGLHFFNPVAQMPLVEIVHAPSTAAETIAKAVALARKIDKLPLPCRSSPGFVVNRVLAPYMQEAMYAAADGFSFDAIDRAATDYGMPVGPVELSDMVGLDVCRHVGAIVGPALGKAVPDMSVLDTKILAGKLGRKSGEGFYRWEAGKVVRNAATRVPYLPSISLPDAAAIKDLQDRLVLIFLNECVAAWREGLVESADMVDAGVIFGSGFAPFRGGPLNDARQRGLASCEQRLRELAERYGPRFTPDAGWSQLR